MKKIYIIPESDSLPITGVNVMEKTSSMVNNDKITDITAAPARRISTLKSIGSLGSIGSL